MQGTIVDLHVHTSYGSSDSVLSPRRLAEHAPHIGLHGAAVTEHSTLWPQDLMERLHTEERVFLSPCREVETDMGHILVLGLDHQVRYNGHVHAVQAALEGLRQTTNPLLPAPATELRRIVRDEGGMLILAHPFRYFHSSRNLLFDGPEALKLSPAQLAEHPVFSLVDEIEVLNGDCTDQENQLALAVAEVLDKRGTGGSDAHTAHELGRCVTVFENPIATVADLVREIVLGRFAVARRVWQPGVMIEGFRPWGGES